MTTVVEITDINANLGSLLGTEGGAKKTGGGKRDGAGDMVALNARSDDFVGGVGGLSRCGTFPFQYVGWAPSCEMRWFQYELSIARYAHVEMRPSLAAEGTMSLMFFYNFFLFIWSGTPCRWG